MTQSADAAFRSGSPAYRALKLDEWHTRSSDRGMSAAGQHTIKFNIPISVAEQAAEIVASRRYPFRAYSDIWRDAVTIGIAVRFMQLKDPDFKGIKDELTQKFEREQERLKREARRTVISECQTLMFGTAHERARGIEMTKNAIASMPDPELRAQLEALLK